MADLAEAGRADMGAHGETGTGVGCVCSSSAGEYGLPLAPGSRKEKKLCDMECLWWCPRLKEEDDEPRDAVISSGVGPSSVAGGRPPKVKPAPRGVRGPPPMWRELGMLMAGPAEGMALMDASSSTRKSPLPSPSSEMEDEGREPGRGKKMERLRECSRLCRREDLAGASGAD